MIRQHRMNVIFIPIRNSGLVVPAFVFQHIQRFLKGRHFFLYRPQKKQEQETSYMRNNLEVGDEVTTIGGIIGAIVSMKGETVTIETSADRTKIRVMRDSIRSVDVPVHPKEDTSAQKAKKPEKADKSEKADGKDGGEKK